MGGSWAVGWVVWALNLPQILFYIYHISTYDSYVHARKFFGPQMALAYQLDAISQGPKKLSISRAQPPPTCPLNGYAVMHASITLCMGLADEA
jgi:hypothetical protein